MKFGVGAADKKFVSIQYNSHATFEVFMEMTLLLLAAG